MQSNNIPQYILERGTSAREYRRRSSCMSRSSNSSMNQARTQKDNSDISSPRVLASAFDAEEGFVDTDELANYKLGTALVHQQQIHKNKLDEYEVSTVSNMSLLSNHYAFSSDQTTIGDALHRNRGSNASEFSDRPSQYTRVPSIASSNVPAKAQQQLQQPQRFGMARP
ncbi:hypothetical protein FB639_004417, partial [Coemansia asiatica]